MFDLAHSVTFKYQMAVLTLILIREDFYNDFCAPHGALNKISEFVCGTMLHSLLKNTL